MFILGIIATGIYAVATQPPQPAEVHKPVATVAQAGKYLDADDLQIYARALKHLTSVHKSYKRFKTIDDVISYEINVEDDAEKQHEKDIQIAGWRYEAMHNIAQSLKDNPEVDVHCDVSSGGADCTANQYP